MIVSAAWRPDWIATCATPGRLSRLMRSPMTKTSGCPGIVQSGSTFTRPARSISAPALRRRGVRAATPDARSPDLRRRINPPQLRLRRVRLDALLVNAGDPRADVDLDSHVSQVARRALSQRLGEGRQDRRPGVEQDDSRRGRIDVTEVPAQRSARQLGELARELDTRRSRADDDERQPAASCVGSVSRSAISKAPKIRPRSSSAWSIVFIPGASCANSGCPKYDWLAPVATIKLSYSTSLADQSSPR